MIVLYAEDDVDDFYFFREVVNELNSEVECINTRSGVETIEYLDNAIILPDLIVLDINMPAMDGKACLKNIKKDSKFKSIPVIIYTTTLTARDNEHCLQLGASECIQKPTSVAEAHKKLLKYFNSPN
jgi:CheY-like chemotaxis protein